MSIYLETKNILVSEVEDYDDEVYAKVELAKAGNSSQVKDDLIKLKAKVAEDYPEKNLVIYSYDNLDSFTEGAYVSLAKDFMYKIDALGQADEADKFKLPKGFKSYFIETEEGYFVTIDDDDNSVKDVASLDLFVYDNSMCIGEVYTDEDYRRKGLASALIQLVRSTYKDLYLTLHTEEDNEAACKLYEGLGFYKEQIIYNYASLQEED